MCLVIFNVGVKICQVQREIINWISLNTKLYMLYILRFYYRQISRWLTVNGWQTGHINTYRFEAGRIRCICVNTFIDSVLQCKLICQVIFISISNISLAGVNSIFKTLQSDL